VLRALANVFVSESLSVLGPANFDKLVTAVGGIVTTDLTLSGSFTANGSVLFLDDILVEGALNAESINVEHDAMIGGLLSASMLEVEDGALIKGGLSIEGELIVNGQSITDAAFKPDAESKIDLGQLIIHDTLFVLGDVTIEGVTKFLGAVDIEGELSVNKNQAGLAMIPKTGTEVTVEFDPPFINMPVVTASSDSFDPWRLAFRSQTGFILQVKDPAEENIMFTWTALTVKDLQVVAGHMGDGTEVIEFPVDQYGVPFSSNEAWNGCIRGQPLLDSDGKPYSCSRYHDDDTWEHPDLLVEFRWNTEKTPRLVLPEGYRVISETRNEEDSEDLEDAEETTSTQEPRPASPESAAADGGGSGGTDENVTTGSGSDFSENGSSIVPSDEPETGSGTLVQEEDDTGSGSAREPLAEEEPEAGTGSSVTQEPEVTEEVPEEIQESEEAVRDPERDLSSEEVVPEDAPVDNEESPLESQEVVFTEEDNLVETTESLAE